MPKAEVKMDKLSNIPQIKIDMGLFINVMDLIFLFLT